MQKPRHTSSELASISLSKSSIVFVRRDVSGGKLLCAADNYSSSYTDLGRGTKNRSDKGLADTRLLRAAAGRGPHGQSKSAAGGENGQRRRGREENETETTSRARCKKKHMVSRPLVTTTRQQSRPGGGDETITTTATRTLVVPRSERGT